VVAWTDEGEGVDVIVKVQASQKSNDDTRRVLVYDKRRKFVQEHSDPKIVDAFTRALAGDPKGYFLATLVHDSFELGERVRDQSW